MKWSYPLGSCLNLGLKINIQHYDSFRRILKTSIRHYDSFRRILKTSIRHYDSFRGTLKQDMTSRYNLCGFWCLLTHEASV